MDEEIKKLYDFLKGNKLTFEQFIRVFNFVMSKDRADIGTYIKAYEQGTFKHLGQY